MLAIAFGIAAIAMLVMSVISLVRYSKTREDGWLALLPTIAFFLFGLVSYAEMSPSVRQIAIESSFAASAALAVLAWCGKRQTARARGR